MMQLQRQGCAMHGAGQARPVPEGSNHQPARPRPSEPSVSACAARPLVALNMGIFEDVSDGVKVAMKAKDAPRVQTMRLIKNALQVPPLPQERANRGHIPCQKTPRPLFPALSFDHIIPRHNRKRPPRALNSTPGCFQTHTATPLPLTPQLFRPQEPQHE